MAAAPKPGRVAVVALSGAAHVAVLALLALHAPRLRATAPEPEAFPEPVIPVLLLPRERRRPSPEQAAPRPIRLHRAKQPPSAGEAPVPPLIVPEARAEAAPAPAAAREPLDAGVREALRGRRGCDDPGLTRRERDACLDRSFADGRGGAPMGLGVNRDKARVLDAAVRRNESNYRYKRSLPGPPVPVPPGAGWDEQRSPGPAPSEALGATPHRIPF